MPTTRIADQEHGSAPVLLRLAKLAERVVCQSLGLTLRELDKQLLDHVRNDVTWRDGVDADAVRASLHVAC